MHTAKIFQNGQSQAVRIPKEFRFKGKEVLIKKIGQAVILMPKDNPWEPMFDSLKRFTNDFMTERNQPPLQSRDSLL